MTMVSVSRRALRDGRRSLIGWSIGLAILVVFTMAIWPSMRNTNFDDLMKDMPDALKSFVGEQSLSSPAGYLESQFFLFLTPMLFLIFAIGRGSDAIAGEERRKTLDLLLANPIERRTVVLEKAAAIVLQVLALGAVFVVVLWISAELFDMDIGVVDLIVPTAGSAGLGLVFGTLALAVGSGTGTKGSAIAVSAGLATFGYLVNSLAGAVDTLEGARALSPFHYGVGASPVAEGLSASDFAVLVGLCAIFLVAAVIFFKRRDIAV
jgi:ABC-2 type transport system permease protein